MDGFESDDTPRGLGMRSAKSMKKLKLQEAQKESGFTHSEIKDLIKQVPVLTFKKINRSPELQDPAFCRVSAF